MRNTGYYWVNIHSSYGWQLGYYHQGTNRWSFLITKHEWTDDLFIEIDEREIVRQPDFIKDLK